LATFQNEYNKILEDYIDLYNRKLNGDSSVETDLNTKNNQLAEMVRQIQSNNAGVNKSVTTMSDNYRENLGKVLYQNSAGIEHQKKDLLFRDEALQSAQSLAEQMRQGYLYQKKIFYTLLVITLIMAGLCIFLYIMMTQNDNLKSEEKIGEESTIEQNAEIATADDTEVAEAEEEEAKAKEEESQEEEGGDDEGEDEGDEDEDEEGDEDEDEEGDEDYEDEDED
jgi:cell division protein FtsL